MVDDTKLLFLIWNLAILSCFILKINKTLPSYINRKLVLILISESVGMFVLENQVELGELTTQPFCIYISAKALLRSVTLET